MFCKYCVPIPTCMIHEDIGCAITIIGVYLIIYKITIMLNHTRKSQTEQHDSKIYLGTYYKSIILQIYKSYNIIKLYTFGNNY
jgi:hypothetical protein